MTFDFMRDSESAYKLAILSLSHMKCDENAGSSVADLNARAVRLLRLAAVDFEPARQLLAACYMENLIDGGTPATMAATPTRDMRSCARNAKRKELNACGVL